MSDRISLKDLRDLGKAVESKNVEEARKILDGNPKIASMVFRYKNKNITWMQFCILFGNVVFVKLFESYGAKLDEKALRDAGKSGDILDFDIVQYFEEQGIDLTPFVDILLVSAVKSGNMAWVRKFVEDYQADVNLVSNEKTLLYVASQNNQSDIVKYLLRRGAKTVVIGDYYAFLPSPLAGFASHGNIPMLKILLKHGAEIDDETMGSAIYNLTSIKFLRVVGMTLDSRLVLKELYSGSVDLRTFKYIRKIFFRKFTFETSLIYRLIYYRRNDLAKFVVRYGTWERCFIDPDDVSNMVKINNMLIDREDTELFLFFNRKFQWPRHHAGGNSSDDYSDDYSDDEHVEEVDIYCEQWFCFLKKAIELENIELVQFIINKKGWYHKDATSSDWWSEECIIHSLSSDAKKQLWNFIYPSFKYPKEDDMYFPPPPGFECRESNICPIYYNELKPGETVACSKCRKPFSKKGIDEWKRENMSCPWCKEISIFYLI